MSVPYWTHFRWCTKLEQIWGVMWDAARDVGTIWARKMNGGEDGDGEAPADAAKKA